MKLYWCKGGPYLGFYQERGSTVRIVGYRTVTKTIRVEHTGMKEIMVPVSHTGVWIYVPGHYEDKWFFVPEETVTKTRTVPEHYEDREVFEPAHWGTREYWLEPHIEIQYREVPGHLEIKKEYVQGHYEEKTETTPAHWGTREYWLEPHIEIQYRYEGEPGLEAGRAGWVAYEVEIPGCWEERRIWFPDVTRTYKVWVEGDYLDVEVWIDTYTESYEVEIPGCYQERRIWFPDVTRTYKILVPEHEEQYTEVIPAHSAMKRVWVEPYDKFTPGYTTIEKKMVETTWYAWEDVEFDDPIFAYADPLAIGNYELVSRKRGAVWPPEFAWDTLEIRNVFTDEVFEMEAEYVGLAVRNDDNLYTIPLGKAVEPTREQELSE